jgi:hypothetical protein
MAKQRNRSENLTDEHIEIIVSLLDGWTVSKLTWRTLIEGIYFKTKQHYTRQALSKHTRIKTAYDITKKRLLTERGKEPTNKLSTDVLLQKLQKIEAENMRLKQENINLLEQFSRWAYNAYSKGITIEELNKNLPNIDRR